MVEYAPTLILSIIPDTELTAPITEFTDLNALREGTLLERCPRDITNYFYSFMKQPSYFLEHLTKLVRKYLDAYVEGNCKGWKEAIKIVSKLGYTHCAQIRDNLIRSITLYYHELPGELINFKYHFHNRRDKIYYRFISICCTFARGVYKRPGKQCWVIYQDSSKKYGTYHCYVNICPYYIKGEQCQQKTCIPRRKFTQLIYRFRIFCNRQEEVTYHLGPRKPERCPFGCVEPLQDNSSPTQGFMMYHTIRVLKPNEVDPYFELKIDNRYRTLLSIVLDTTEAWYHHNHPQYRRFYSNKEHFTKMI